MLLKSYVCGILANHESGSKTLQVFTLHHAWTARSGRGSSRAVQAWHEILEYYTRTSLYNKLINYMQTLYSNY